MNPMGKLDHSWGWVTVVGVILDKAKFKKYLPIKNVTTLIIFFTKITCFNMVLHMSNKLNIYIVGF